MKVYVDPIPSTLSRAMHRVANALRRHAPAGINFVQRPEQADLQVMHVIGLDSLEACRAPHHVIIQYCLGTTGVVGEVWQAAWQRAAAVVSYYDLRKNVNWQFDNFLRIPLGADPAFLGQPGFAFRDIGVITSGYVSGPGAEAIEEVAIAASLAGLKTVHIGPMPVGMGKPPLGWSFKYGVSDAELADLYSRAQWVSGLRHVEGFELPMVEGFMCGARPIAFYREDMRHWWEDSADYVPELSGKPLIEALVHLFREPAREVSESERARAADLFNWPRVVDQFWAHALQQVVRA